MPIVDVKDAKRSVLYREVRTLAENAITTSPKHALIAAPGRSVCDYCASTFPEPIIKMLAGNILHEMFISDTELLIEGLQEQIALAREAAKS